MRQRGVRSEAGAARQARQVCSIQAEKSSGGKKQRGAYPFEIFLEAGHAEGGRVLDPSLGGVCDDVCLAYLLCASQQCLHDALEGRELLAHLRRDGAVLTLHHLEVTYTCTEV